MANSTSLHHDAANLRSQAEARLRAAENANTRADAYSRSGDFTKATYENDNASRYSLEAMQLQEEAVAKETQAAEIELRLADIDKREQEIQANCRTQIDALESKKRDLRGT